MLLVAAAVPAAAALVLVVGAVGLAYISVVLPEGRRAHCARMVELLLGPLVRRSAWWPGTADGKPRTDVSDAADVENVPETKE